MVPISNLKPLKKRWLGTCSYHKKFGGTLALPKTLGRERMYLPDQQDTDFCTAYGEAVSNGFKYGIRFSPEWQTAMESRYLGRPITDGADAESSMDSCVLNGSLPQSLCATTLAIQGPAYVANWNNYDRGLGDKATPYAPGIPYKVDGPYDIFDNIRSALFQEYSVDKSVVKAFGYWYQSFNDIAADPSKKGLLSLPPDSPITLHRYTFMDFDTIDGTEVLVAALTQGPDFGDGGYLYFDRETVNFIFKDLQSGLGLYIDKPASSDWPTALAHFRIILNQLLVPWILSQKH